MKSQRNIARQFFGLTLTLVGLMSWNTLPVYLSGRAVQAATRARVTEPTGQPVSRGVINGRVAFVSSEGNARADIYTMEADGSNVQRLTNNPAYDQGPKWSPDGTKIAFASSRDDTSVRCASGGGCWLEIYVMNPDGTNQTRTNNPGFDDSFDWSPDSTRIVFQSFHDGSLGSISVMNADGSNVRRLTNYPGYDLSPKWSPDGTKIAFLRADDDFASTSEIYVMNSDGAKQTRLSNLTGYDSRWSPDGTKIVFVSADIFNASTQEIYVMNADGSNVQRLTNNQTGDSNPAWSPDGSKVTFTRACQHNRCPTQQPPHIWVVNADGSNPTQLTDILAYGSAWSPDGTKIIFGGPDSGAADLFVMNPDGSGLTNITNTDGKWETSPSWQPLSLPPVVNPIDDPQFFVRQHYLDFLGREPDAAGLTFWTNEITSCGADVQCVEVKRINVSAAFFLSIEFQQTGYLVYKTYAAAFGPTRIAATMTRSEFLPDVQSVAQGVVVLATGWQEQLEANQAAYFNQFVQRPNFVATYPRTMTSAQYVDSLNANAGGALSSSERDQLVQELSSGAKTRALVLRAVAENEAFTRAHFNRAFVLMQYFGYLRRNPNDAPDNNFAGYNFWLAKLDEFNGNYIEAEMVKAFIASTEYRQRFGP
jgi:Tol biopolymer transport system component